MAEPRRSENIKTKSNGAGHQQQHNKIELPLCELCSELTVESLQDGFYIGTSCELRRRSGNCRLCQLISSALDLPGMDLSKPFKIRLRDASDSIRFLDKHTRLEIARQIPSPSRISRSTFVVCEADTGATWLEGALFRLFAHEGNSIPIEILFAD